MSIAKKDEADALVGQFGHTIANAVDPITADYLVKRCGEAMHTDDGGSWSPANRLEERIKGTGQWTTSYSKHVRSIRMNTDFMTGHKTGGGEVTAWIIRTGDSFRNELNHIFCTFKQEKK